MNLINRGAAGLTLALALSISAGCSGNTALIRREAPVRPSQPVQDKLVAAVAPGHCVEGDLFASNSGRREMVAYRTVGDNVDDSAIYGIC